LKVGDLLWQSRLPGGVCMYLGERVERMELDDGSIRDEIIYDVLHPTEGMVSEPDYYYETLDRAVDRAAKHSY